MENLSINGSGTGRRGLTGSALKAIAIVAMLIDHTTHAFVPAYTPLYIVLRCVGRITAPIMFYLLVEGYYNTRNIFKYTWRMALFALVSWLPFYYFGNGTLPTATDFAPVGVIYTLFLGLLALRALHEIRFQNPRFKWLAGILKFLAILALLLLSSLGDWAIFGILYVLVFNQFRGSYPKQALGALVLIVLQCVPPLGPSLDMVSPGYLAIQAGQVLPLILLYFYNGERGRGGKVSKWFFYVFYPAHLIILGVLRWGLPSLPF